MPAQLWQTRNYWCHHQCICASNDLLSRWYWVGMNSIESDLEGALRTLNSRSTRGRSRGRGGRGNYGWGCGNFRQQGASTSEQSGEGRSAWTATAHAAQSNYSQGRLGNEIQWLLESGCTDHIINSVDYFDKCIDLKEPVNIYLGDNRYIKTTKNGNVVIYFDAFGKKNEVNMSNVFYARKMNTNFGNKFWKINR